MKRDFTAIVGAGFLTLSAAILPLSLPAQAQVDTAPRVDNVPRTRADQRNDFDWGWLGLIGLLGLAGLAGRRQHEEPTRYRDPNAPGATSYRD
jgi:MYXO-CTERM domain-containing protein